MVHVNIKMDYTDDDFFDELSPSEREEVVDSHIADASDDVVVSEVIRRKMTDSIEILEDLSDDTIINEVIRRNIADSDEIIGYLVRLGYFKEKE